ncbi:hypothetical protein Q7C36_010093 [Tachysurus vachellii]|uniref:Uncharacterized protein n=1 Tax=Tachysurus vachellii TaxID=175792 RepID=A0AA88N2D1_TACVA|nr:hypothetical protein Q7C36_010093 [Tachysurus vachellii]
MIVGVHDYAANQKESEEKDEASGRDGIRQTFPNGRKEYSKAFFLGSFSCPELACLPRAFFYIINPAWPLKEVFERKREMEED